MERWQQICDEIDITRINETINQVKDLHLSMMSKMNVVLDINEGQEAFDPSFENYLRSRSRIPFLYYLAIVSSPHEERMQHINQIDHIFHQSAMSLDVSNDDLDHGRNNAILDFHEIDPELASALRQRNIDRRMRRAIERYGRPIVGEWETCPIDQGMKHASIERIEVIQQLRPIIDHDQHNHRVIRQSLELGLTFESYSVLLEEFRYDLLQKIEEIQSDDPSDHLCSKLLAIYHT